jgi:hypothetical protein
MLMLLQVYSQKKISVMWLLHVCMQEIMWSSTLELYCKLNIQFMPLTLASVQGYCEK